jgi:8-oxo-dGTP pyrophosphatase MutT (NUDIX family)/phosphohistidine phosphatase SixA
MPDRQAADEIRAAGAVLWRPAGRGTQVALVHRPKYDDWALAKGKLEPGEHVVLAAVREVREETGFRITLGLCLSPVRYDVAGQPKVVDYWAARVDPSAGQFRANHEVDQLDWVALSQAETRLSYHHDAALVAEFRAAPRPTTPVILVRHASAGSKADWRKKDVLRPLDGQGKLQARELAALLACFGSGRVLSSPAERCLATVRPYASDTGMEIEVVPAFGLPEPGAKKAARRAIEAGLAEAAAQATSDERPVVICAHRENVPMLLSAVCDQLGAAVPADPPLRKGGFMVLHRTGRRLAGVERHQPEGDQLRDRPGGLPVQRRRERALQDEQPPLHLQASPAAISAEAVAGQHSVARHDDGDRVRAHDLAHQARGRYVARGR